MSCYVSVVVLDISLVKCSDFLPPLLTSIERSSHAHGPVLIRL